MAEEYGQWLGRHLKRRGMTQSELAEQVGVTRAAVSTWVSGRVTPRADTLRRIEVAIGAGTDIKTPEVGTERDDVLIGQRRSSVAPTWYHRPAHQDGGREYGNAAAFAFDADLGVLARETTQNSLDEALVGADGTVRVRHVLHEISGERLDRFKSAIQWESLRRHYESVAGSNQKTARVLKSGLKEMEQENGRLILLRIDDFNARGLTGDDYGDGRFAAVVRRQLDSHKSSTGAGGSYGLGKATLWSASKLGIVLINSTLSEPLSGRSERRVIGRADLPWHELSHVPFAGPAWFGMPDPARGDATRSWFADSATVEDLHLTRDGDEPGTSFLVVAAHEGVEEDADLESMHQSLLRGLGRNFWASLVATPDGHPLLKASVVALRNGVEVIPETEVKPEEYEPSRARALRAYLQGATDDRLTSRNSVIVREIPLKVPALREPSSAEESTAVEHRAVMLLTPAEDDEKNPNQLVCMRGSRMVVMSQTINPPLGGHPYQAVVLAGRAAGRDSAGARAAERFLRTAEPPDHNAWKRTEDLVTTYSRGAVKSITDFRRGMREAVLAATAPQAGSAEGEALPPVLRDILRIEAPKGPPRNSRAFPTVDDLHGQLNEDGAWDVTVEVGLPQREDPWALVPVLRFVTRSGPKPTVRWDRLISVSNCEVTSEGVLRIRAGARRAEFRGITDVGDHPVAGHLARIEVDVQRAKEQTQ
ncbi:helix-turn-helix transcriptional regulator [Streptomyces sp. NPDC055099]